MPNQYSGSRGVADDRGRLDRPPSPESRAKLPADFGRRFLIIVDTEEEFDWRGPPERGTTATTAIASLPAAHARLKALGAAPAYAIDYPIADNPESAEIIRDLTDGGAEIGAQLHAWVNPPFDEPLWRTNSFAGNLPETVEQAKLAALTGRITEAVGRKPIFYRAGRYGVGPNTARLIADAGYRIDVSVRSRFDYHSEGGPDFSRHPIWPWWAGGGSHLLAVPLTAGYIGRISGHGNWLYPAIRNMAGVRSLLARSGLLSRIAFTPEGMPADEVVQLIDQMLESDVPIFSFSFHSPSVEPGHTPYVRDAADLKRFWHWWDIVLGHLANAGVTAIQPAELLAAAQTMR